MVFIFHGRMAVASLFEEIGDDVFELITRRLPNSDLRSLACCSRAMREKVEWLTQIRPLVRHTTQTLTLKPQDYDTDASPIQQPKEEAPLIIEQQILSPVNVVHRLDHNTLLFVTPQTGLFVCDTKISQSDYYTLDDLVMQKADMRVELDIIRTHPYFLLLASSTDQYCYYIPKLNDRWIWTLPQKIRLSGYFRDALFAGPHSPYLFVLVSDTSLRDNWQIIRPKRQPPQNKLLVIDMGHNRVIDTFSLEGTPRSLAFDLIEPHKLHITFTSSSVLSIRVFANPETLSR